LRSTQLENLFPFLTTLLPPAPRAGQNPILVFFHGRRFFSQPEGGWGGLVAPLPPGAGKPGSTSLLFLSLSCSSKEGPFSCLFSLPEWFKLFSPFPLAGLRKGILARVPGRAETKGGPFFFFFPFLFPSAKLKGEMEGEVFFLLILAWFLLPPHPTRGEESGCVFLLRHRAGKTLFFFFSCGLTKARRLTFSSSWAFFLPGP